MPIAGSAEAPGALQVTGKGRWLVCYSPYNTFDPNVKVERNQVVLLRSDTRGASWQWGAMLRDERPGSTFAEAWAIELADGRLLGTAWHMNQTDGSDHPNAYAISKDAGVTWSPTRSTGIMGQATSLVPLPDGRGLFVFNQRKHGEVGVWSTVVRPSETDFGVEASQIVWSAQQPTQGASAGEHSAWTDFAFGEPCVACLPDGSFILVLWCTQPSGSGIAYVRLRATE